MNQQITIERKAPVILNKTLLGIVLVLLAVFVVRTALAARGSVPRLNDLFTLITLAGSLVVWIKGYRSLKAMDWIIALVVGEVVGIGMAFATLFSPYPILDIVDGNIGQALARGFGTTLAMLGGLTIMRQGGPVLVRTTNRQWHRLLQSLAIGLAAGAPLAVLNVFANQLTQGRPIEWQNPLAAAFDALQPGIVEEVMYRFAFLGLLWLLLRRPLPDQAPWLAGLLALLVHTFIHFDELFLEAPLVALGMGLVMSVVWGLPLTILALRRDLEAATVFHWFQDFTRFLAGF